jgi:hypothetical protein
MGDKALVYGRLAQARGFSFFFSFPFAYCKLPLFFSVGGSLIEANQAGESGEEAYKGLN